MESDIVGCTCLGSNRPARRMTTPTARDCWFLTGPTASGKTRLALELARRLDGEIVSLDSMAPYRGLDIGTAKPSIAERQAVPHHLIDVIEPSETRPRLISALWPLINKREQRPQKKHGLVPL